MVSLRLAVLLAHVFIAKHSSCRLTLNLNALHNKRQGKDTEILG